MRKSNKKFWSITRKFISLTMMSICMFVFKNNIYSVGLPSELAEVISQAVSVSQDKLSNSIVDLNESNDTIIHLLVENDKFEELKLIIEFLKNPEIIKELLNKKNKNGDVPLHYAAERGNLLIIQYLVDNGAIVNIGNDLGHTDRKSVV